MKVLICDNIEELGEDFVKWCMNVLPEWRKEQMLKMKHLRGQIQCAVGYLMVMECIGIHRDACNERWVYNEHGKPYFYGRDDLFFNISHCKSAVAVAVDDEEVGIDIEEVARYKESLVKYVLNDEEKSREYGVGSREERFIELWTEKEAVFKLYGTGITHDIKDVLKSYDGNLYTWKFGGKVMTVATRKIISY